MAAATKYQTQKNNEGRKTKGRGGGEHPNTLQKKLHDGLKKAGGTHCDPKLSRAPPRKVFHPHHKSGHPAAVFGQGNIHAAWHAGQTALAKLLSGGHSKSLATKSRILAERHVPAPRRRPAVAFFPDNMQLLSLLHPGHVSSRRVVRHDPDEIFTSGTLIGCRRRCGVRIN